MRAVMHPTGVMRLHLQGVDERLIKIVVHQVLRKTFVTKLLNHCHDIRGRSQSRGSLDVSNNLGIKLIVGNPANFSTLHRIPKSNTLLVCTRSLAVVRQLIREGPFADLINSPRREPNKLSKIVVRQVRLCRDGRATIDKTISAGVVTTVGAPKRCQIDILTVAIMYRHTTVIISRRRRCWGRRWCRCWRWRWCRRWRRRWRWRWRWRWCRRWCRRWCWRWCWRWRRRWCWSW